MENLIEITELTKKYEGKTVLENVSFDIPSGRIVGLLGPNGAGKTTIIKILAGVINDYKGKVLINHEPPGIYTKSIVSYLPDKTYFSNWMKVSDTINLFDDFYEDFDRAKAMKLLKRLNIDEKLKITKLSKGIYEKLQLVIVMSRKARVYILDEPLGGVDPASRDVILDTILTNYSEDSSVILSTQLIQDVERVFDKVIMIKDKEIFINEDVDTLRLKYGKSVDEIFREVFRCS
ncbi:ABC transporter ATP-binding protein [Clostridium oryzae]|uniref:SkfA peptide export ATP-binding protein SkfE n=1 Tax=Clostridium oryzae TaxID=1450648 RepID=A0A1V4I9K7_9CLOT|nr:ABC transporter ATP-binding protein [Clostridium oryzae]OPJ56603.1 SkfA peptide export ATP-binding protein SkfE [Clostridium oryzae]